MEWWLIVSGAFNIGLAVVVAYQYFGWKASDERADKYQDAFSDTLTKNGYADRDIQELRETLKDYSDRVFQIDEDTWLTVFRSGVETNE